jgi:amino acid adenylation domain-containing protein
MSTLNQIQLLTENVSLVEPRSQPNCHDWYIHQLIESQVEQTPDAVALLFEGGQLTYRELNRQANQLAHYLRSIGVGPEVPVAICVERSVQMVVGFLGVLKAGGAYVPLDPAYPQERLAFMLADSQAPILLTQDRLVKGLPQHKAKLVRLDADWPVIARQNQENPANQTQAGHLAYLIYTSGSTGRPKGVMISHGALAGFSEVARVEYELKTTDRVLQFASMSFDTAVEEIYPGLICGAALALRPELGSMSAFLQQCQDWAITVLDLPTAFWHQLATALSVENLQFPPSIRLVIIGGEKALPEQLHTWQRHVDRRVRLVNTYGPTETTVVATSCDLSLPSEFQTTQGSPRSGQAETSTVLSPGQGQAEALPDVPIGWPLSNTQVYLLDPSGQPVAAGADGEMFIGGTGLARGYLNRPDLTADRFRPDLFSRQPGSRLYKTGDLARCRPDGQLEFIGRADQQVKVRGYRIELGEIEAALRQHPAVQEAVVLAWDVGQGLGDKRLAAYITAKQNFRLRIEELRHFLEDKLPYYMMPAAFILLEKLPMTPNGKIDRRALPAPDKARPEMTQPYLPPRTPTEESLASLWAALLDIDRVGVHDDFMELGGHSLLATQLISRIRDIFQIELSLLYLFEAATIANLAQHIEMIRQARQVVYQPVNPLPFHGGEAEVVGSKRDEGEL